MTCGCKETCFITLTDFTGSNGLYVPSGTKFKIYSIESYVKTEPPSTQGAVFSGKDVSDPDDLADVDELIESGVENEDYEFGECDTTCGCGLFTGGVVTGSCYKKCIKQPTDQVATRYRVPAGSQSDPLTTTFPVPDTGISGETTNTIWRNDLTPAVQSSFSFGSLVQWNDNDIPSPGSNAFRNIIVPPPLSCDEVNPTYEYRVVKGGEGRAGVFVSEEGSIILDQSTGEYIDWLTSGSPALVGSAVVGTDHTSVFTRTGAFSIQPYLVDDSALLTVTLQYRQVGDTNWTNVSSSWANSYNTSFDVDTVIEANYQCDDLGNCTSVLFPPALEADLIADGYEKVDCLGVERILTIDSDFKTREDGQDWIILKATTANAVYLVDSSTMEDFEEFCVSFEDDANGVGQVVDQSGMIIDPNVASGAPQAVAVLTVIEDSMCFIMIEGKLRVKIG